MMSIEEGGGGTRLCHAFLVLPYQCNPCTDCKSAQ